MKKKQAFERYGNTKHLRLRTADDLAAVLELDEALWIATSAPISTINMDKDFLAILDADNDDRIRCRDLRREIRHLFRLLCRYDGIEQESDTVDIACINQDTAEGRQIHDAFRKLSGCTGDGTSLSLKMIRDAEAELLSSPISGAGVILPKAGETESGEAEFISEAIRITGGVPHPSGKPGINRMKLNEFTSGIGLYKEWEKELDIPGAKKSILPFGDDTAAVKHGVDALDGEVKRFYLLCGIAAAGALQIRNYSYDPLGGEDAAAGELLEKLPLQKVRPDGIIRMNDPVNPKYRRQFDTLTEPLRKWFPSETETGISESFWMRLKEILVPYSEWMAKRPQGPYETLPKYFFNGEKLTDAVRGIDALLTESEKSAYTIEEVRLLEKLVLSQANILCFANNFVSFPQLYNISSRAAFETGTLIMDGRHFNLAVPVLNRELHKRTAVSSGMYVLYVAIYDKSGAVSKVAAIPVTSGGVGNLGIGKRGIFHDIHGLEQDAEVVDIIENPVSIREAVAAPFKRLGRLVTGKIESITMEAEKKLDDTTVIAVDRLQPGETQPVSVPRQTPPGGTAGMIAAGGVAVAAVSSALAFITKTLAEIAWWQILIGFGSAALAVVIPASISAFLKLRKRDISSIIEASGWAVNARMRLKYRQSRFFTHAPGKLLRVKKKNTAVNIKKA
ncbi:MAG: hypothetical protein ACLFSE_00645 [Spirochaetia bacterium]